MSTPTTASRRPTDRPARRAVNDTGSPAAVVVGGSVNAVSIARSLAPDSIEVIALGTTGLDPVRNSRHCHRYVRMRSPEDGLQAAWLAWLRENAEALRDAVLLPADDEALELIAHHRTQLVGLGYHPFEADDQALLEMLDKDQTAQVARRAGIPQPHTVAIRDDESLERAVAELDFPFALKPLHSHVLARLRGWGKLEIAHDSQRLDELMSELRAHGVAVLATEVIPGPDDQLVSYYSYLDEHGKPLLHFCKQQLRAHPPRFGLSTYQRSLWDPEVADAGLRFFAAAGVRGLVNVQFKRDARDGRLMLIECNHRFTASNELVRLAGINLARLTYDRALGRPTPPVGAARNDIRLWEPIHDARSMLKLRAAGEITIRRWMASLLHRQHMPLLSVDDPGPATSYLSSAMHFLRDCRPG
jgi:D-aspartate ligase